MHTPTFDPPAIATDHAIGDDIRGRVTAAFAGFIGNSQAVRTLQRGLGVALTKRPVMLDRTYLLEGPPSTGKTDLAKRMAKVLGLPLLAIDGKAIRTRESLFGMIDDALSARELQAMPKGRQGGLDLYVYPPFAVLIDEVHQMSDRVQQSLLTALEKDDRSVVLEGRGRHVASVRGSCFILATTKPAALDNALRSRTTPVPLERYSTEEVLAMLQARYSHLSDGVAASISGVCRSMPRIAFAIADDLREEVLWGDHRSPTEALKNVLRDRGILTTTGLTRKDIRYLNALAGNCKNRYDPSATGEQVLHALLSDIDRHELADDIEPFLVGRGLVKVTEKGRVLAKGGWEVVEEFRS